uniref:Purple acid phosphatase n=1 Tax=Arcella intermedia TaxID=1963864 RepID=A0A6B2L7B6_9EUKA
MTYSGQGHYVVSWVDLNLSSVSPGLRYGLDPIHLTTMIKGTFSQYTFQNYTSGHLVTTVLSDIAFSKLYYYQVGDLHSGSFSNTFWFKSVPAPGTSNTVFGITADLDGSLNGIGTINGLTSWRNSSGMDAVLHAGDVSYADKYAQGGPVWDDYVQKMQPLTASTPYEIGVGNHEIINNFTGFRLRYSMEEVVKPSGGGEFYWSVDIGLVHLIHLSSENRDTFQAQRDWLIKDLSQVNFHLTPWLIGVWHRPWYCSIKENVDEEMRQYFEPVFQRLDIGFVGHTHYYERTLPLSNQKIVKDGPEYVVVGNGGNIEGTAAIPDIRPDWSVMVTDEFGFGILNVVNGTHALWEMRRSSNYTILDQHWFVKQRT